MNRIRSDTIPKSKRIRSPEVLEAMAIPSVINLTDNNQFTRYLPELYPAQAFVLTKDHGFTKGQLAEVFGVNVSQIKSWIKKYEDFEMSIIAGTDEYDSYVVEKTYLKRILGYEYNEDEYEPEMEVEYLVDDDGSLVCDGNGQGVKVGTRSTGQMKLVKRKVKQKAPSVEGMQWWLTNRSKPRDGNEARWQNIKNINIKKESTITFRHIEEMRLKVEAVKNLPKGEIIELINLTKKLSSAGLIEDTRDINP